MGERQWQWVAVRVDWTGVPVHHVGHELHLGLDGCDLLGRRGLRAAESEERHAGRVVGDTGR